MKFIISLLALLIISAPCLSEIKSFDTDKVIIDTETGKVVFTPRDLDYNYHYGNRSIEYDKKPSFKERIFGKKSCGR